MRVLSMYAELGERATVGALGARLPRVTVVEPDAEAELVSVTVASQVMTSPREATLLLMEIVDPVPKDAPVVVLVQT